jgi:hypothetical protein
LRECGPFRRRIAKPFLRSAARVGGLSLITFEADMCAAKDHVCFTPESGHVQCTWQCLLWARSRHLFTSVVDVVASFHGHECGGEESD